MLPPYKTIEDKLEDLEKEMLALQRENRRIKDALESIAQESYPVGGQPTRRQLSQIKMKCMDALADGKEGGR